ncbi:MAG TPA: cytochrome c biogenesis protein CcdA [Bryobacteraceae bacterium]|jgi:thiol:disulfide interchange protein DsbD|nr:cytochrome c biogenesis protein CcdA [Bryobacteraceae bacterium]
MRDRRAASLFAFVALLTLSPKLSAKEDPVQWSLAAARGSEQLAPGGSAFLDLKATIQDGWHLYSPTTPAGGPIITKIRLDDSPAISSWEVLRPQPVRKLDPNFNIDTETYTGQAVFLVRVTAAKSVTGMLPLAVSVRYQACSDVKCLPPVKKTVTTQIATAPGAAPIAALTVPDGYAAVAAPETTSAATAATTNTSAPPPSQPRQATASSPDLLPFLLTAFGAGILALFTPCVFPMIPITVSFFINQNQAAEKRSGVAQAVVFCAGIIVLFTGLGFLVTAVAGPFGVVQLGSNPWVNGFIAAVFLAFGLSLLGAFELRLPSGLLTSLDRASQGGGYGGSLLMGLTFSLTSFACIGPIVGPLLIASVQSKGWQPVLGMLAFATGLALPFFLLALFPAYLKKLPRSGGWMTRVKVVLGFIVLAAMLKYISNIDQVLQTHWLSRERFLAAWIVLFALPGLYLLGFLRLEGIKKDEELGVGRTLLAAVFLIFSISLVPGLFGARLGDLDAFVPEGTGNSIASGSTSAASATAFKNNLEGALSAAREQHKLVLINFTGYACTNCHWMKANMFTRPEISAALGNMIIVDLYTDGTDAESDKNQKLEDQKFNTASIPFYAIVDPDQNVIATFPQLTRDPHEFLAFLETKPAGPAQGTVSTSSGS